MQYSIINYAEVINLSEFRIDAEYYHPEMIKAERILKKNKTSNIDKSNIQFGTTPNGANFQEKGIPFVRSQNFVNGYIESKDIVYISHKEYAEQIKTNLQKNDILIAAVGATIGAIGLSTIGIGSFNQNVARIRLKNSVLPEFFFVFMKGKFGQYQLGKLNTGNAQSYLNTANISSFIVVDLNKSFQIEIKKIVTRFFSLIEKTNNLYVHAENLLISELGLSNWKPKHHLWFVKNYSDTEQAERIDADYFQPKYEDIIQSVKSYSNSWDTLGNLTTLKDKNFNPKDGKQYKYIELSHIAGDGEITDCMTEYGQDLPTRARRIVTTGDVIVSSIEGSLSSISLVSSEYDQALCSTGFYVINSEALNSETLLVFLKSIAGQLQLKKGCNGTILTAINKDEFKKIILPIVSQEKQIQIKKKIIKSFELRKQSKHLLECAKRAVEIAIEKDENKAIKWLEKETKGIQT